MTRFVALLRGVNVGGITVKSAELRALFDELGFADVRTVLASGNVTFASAKRESDAALKALKDKFAGDSAYQIAEVHAFRGETDLAFEWLERAHAQRDGGVMGIKGDPLMRGLVGDPRYTAFLRKMKLPD